MGPSLATRISPIMAYPRVFVSIITVTIVNSPLICRRRVLAGFTKLRVRNSVEIHQQHRVYSSCRGVVVMRWG